MPELPEVEVVRRGLENWITGRTVETAEVFHPRAVRRHQGGPGDFIDRLTGRTLTMPRRRGKYLWIPLAETGEAMLAHLGMSGQLLVGEPDQPHEKHLRARVTFADGGLDLRFVDQRTFGHLMVDALVPDAFAPAALVLDRGPADASDAGTDRTPAGSTADTHNGGTAGGADAGRPQVPLSVAHIAPDPFEESFAEETFFRALRRRDTGIKRALLDQSLISGVGNIYADEALWRARLHWARPTGTLTRAEVGRVLAAARAVMGAALEVGGTSFDSLYVNVNGESGYFDRSLQAYGRRDEPCARCGTPIRRDVFMNRSSYSCPKCQPKPRHPAR